jgi:hypothetical protein
MIGTGKLPTANGQIDSVSRAHVNGKSKRSAQLAHTKIGKEVPVNEIAKVKNLLGEHVGSTKG